MMRNDSHCVVIDLGDVERPESEKLILPSGRGRFGSSTPYCLPDLRTHPEHVGGSTS